MDNLIKFSGEGTVMSDSDLAAKCLFFAYFILRYPTDSGKTRYELLVDDLEVEKPETIIKFLNEFYSFKRNGLKY